MEPAEFNPRCLFCKLPVNHSDPDNWYEITGWVKGSKKDSLSLRGLTGLIAHDACVRKAKDGIAPDQEAMFEMED